MTMNDEEKARLLRECRGAFLDGVWDILPNAYVRVHRWTHGVQSMSVTTGEPVTVFQVECMVDKPMRRLLVEYAEEDATLIQMYGAHERMFEAGQHAARKIVLNLEGSAHG